MFLWNHPFFVILRPLRTRDRRAAPVRLDSVDAHLVRRAHRDDPAAVVAGPGAEVDHPVGRGDHVEVVLDHDDGVTQVCQAVEDAEQPLDVGEVQPGGRLVEEVERPAAGAQGRPSSAASLTRWASPPESVVLDWPSVR